MDVHVLHTFFGFSSSGKAFVIDPKNEVDKYIEMTGSLLLKIVCIIETNIHTDHIPGTKKLQIFTSAPIYMFEDVKIVFGFLPLKEDDNLKIGNAKIEVSHTPESILLLRYNDNRNYKALSTRFTCDILFVGYVGRSYISVIYTSYELMPVHHSGSACNAGISLEVSYTLLYKRLSNPPFQEDLYNDFRKRLGSIQFQPMPEKKKIEELNMGVD